MITVSPWKYHKRIQTFTEVRFEMGHHFGQCRTMPFSFVLNRDLERFFEQFLVLQENLFRICFPLRVFEQFPNRTPGGKGLLGVRHVEDEKLLRGQDVFKNVLILIHIVSHDLVRLIDETSRCPERAAIRVLVLLERTIHIFENLGCVRVTEKFPEKTDQFGMRNHMGFHFAGVQGFIDAAAQQIRIRQQPADLTLEILTGREPPLFDSFQQNPVRCTITHRIGNRESRLARSEHFPAVRVRITRTKLQPV